MDWYRRATTNNMKTLLKTSLLFLLLISCNNNIESATASPTTVILPTETLTSRPSTRPYEIMAIWKDGSHAKTNEPVECEACHQMRNGIVVENADGQNQQSGQHETAVKDEPLCGRCHDESVGKNAHADFTCIACHDPHTTNASCSASGCHSTIQTVFYEVPPTPTDGHPNTGSSFCGGSNCHALATAVANDSGSVHGTFHARVNCMACHDASGMQAMPSLDEGTWGLWQEGENGELEPVFSHDAQREVDCSRCHFEINPWGLNPVTGNEFMK